MKKIFAIILTFCMLSINSLPVFARTSIKDVPARYWASKEIQNIVSSNIMTTDSSNKFYPEKSITRVEFVQSLLKLLSIAIDEFIEEKSNQLKFNQFDAFAHLYETINRNRELLGEDAVQCFFLSNAQTLNSPILAGFNVVNEIERMRYSGQDTLTRGNIYVSLCKNEVSEAKTKTAIYQATKGSKFYDESIRNEFSHDSFTGIGKRNLREYIPIFGYDEWYCYKHKSKPEFYICSAYSNRVPEFKSVNGFSLWARSYWQTMTDAISRGAVYYESYTLKMEFERLMRWR